MRKRDALIELARGNRVRLCTWSKSEYIYQSPESGEIRTDKGSLYQSLIFISPNDTEFELYTKPPEPAKIVQVAPAVVKLTGTHGSIYEITYRLYTSEADARTDCGDTFIKWPAYDGQFVNI